MGGPAAPSEDELERRKKRGQYFMRLDPRSLLDAVVLSIPPKRQKNKKKHQETKPTRTGEGEKRHINSQALLLKRAESYLAVTQRLQRKGKSGKRRRRKTATNA